MGKKDAEPQAAPPFYSPFSALQPLRDQLPTASQAVPKAAPAKKPPARAVVRMERKGHGGKEVTVVDALELRPSELDAWCKELKKSLGCGGTVDEGSMVIQGDHRERVRAWLVERGVKKISVG